MEEFRDIKGYKGFYQVSNIGTVKSLDRTITYSNGRIQQVKGKTLKGLIDSHGYIQVGLCKNGKHSTKRVHRLMAIAFLDHIPCGHVIEVDHINDIKTDNRVENIQLLTSRNHKSKTPKDKGNKTSRFTGVSWHKKTKKWVVQIRSKGKQKNLGYFTNELEASNAYQKALSSL